MELADLTLKHIVNSRQGCYGKIAVVKFPISKEHPKGHCLTFLVDDVEYPQIPGFPAQSLTYFDTVEEAYNAIDKKYKELRYMPEFPETGFWSN